MALLSHGGRWCVAVWCLLLLVLGLAACGGPDAPPEAAGASSSCIGCHREETPGVVTDWELSRHSAAGVECSLCHGDGHSSADDVAFVGMATVEVCADCHPIQAEQFTGGK
ncbi:MAG: multiheme c-type cytochrome, partial [Acidobacteria bacterium]|nr:multiheme c-type cytochrome [Acidobacteriota bacterium]